MPESVPPPKGRCPRCGALRSLAPAAGPCESCLLALALDPGAEGTRERVEAPLGPRQRRRKRSM